MKLPPSRTWYGLALRVDRLLRELLERPLQVIHCDSDVTVTRPELVAVDAEVVGQLEPIPVSGQAHEDVDRLLADRHPPALLEAECGVEGHRAVDVGDPVAGVDELHACDPQVVGAIEREEYAAAGCLASLI